jgi:hypothetical protein
VVAIELPNLLRHRAIRAVMVESHDLAGSIVTSVTTHVGLGRAPKRRWFASRAVALAHAAEVADQHGLPMFDLGSEVE